MQSLAVFDIIILSITLILGLKGLLKGLVKEVFGIIGIVGAVFVASRTSTEVGNLLSPIIGLESPNTISLIGFIASLIGFWVVIYIIATIISKIIGASGLGLFDRVFGFVFGAGKIFLIFAIIAHALTQVNSFKKAIDDKTKDSIVMPYLLSTGAFIMKLDSINIDPNSESPTDKAIKAAQDAVKTVKEANEEITTKVIDGAVDAIKEKALETESITEEQINNLKEQLNNTEKTTEEKTNN